MNLKDSLPAICPDLLWLTAGLALAVVPHSLRTPLWMTVMFFSMALWRLHMEGEGYKGSMKPSLPGRFGRQLIMIMIVVGVFNTYGTLIGRDAGVALLILLAGMKLLELQAERDYYIGAFIGMFLILTNFFYSQTILTALHMLLTVIIILAALISLNDRNNYLDAQRRVKLAASLLFQSIPLLLILFVLFPRVDGPLWGLPKDARAGTSGLDDEMSPGQISQLSLSDEVAFRVEFFDAIPEKSSLYWRGPVLWYSDGVKWVGDKSRVGPASVTVRGKAIRYAVTLEATDQSWLYGLEMATAPPQHTFFSHDLQIRTRSPLHNRKRYELSSHTQFNIAARDRAELEHALQLPQGYHPKARKLGQSWRNSAENSREIVAMALQMFNREAFYYTLNPPLLLDDSVDEFIFETRQGFCEHYAAAFVILMRAAGIPARVVTGYQGGSLNPVGNYLVVRQHDAHAWAEVWLAGDGWVRVDPTASVSPERIREGIENALPESLIKIPLGLQNIKIAREIWRHISNNLDALNNHWNQWVLGYNNKRQSRFLNQIGFRNIDWRGMTGWLLMLLMLVLASVAYHLFKTGREDKDEARFLYDRFCRKLARCGIQRQASEGPMDFASRAGRRRSDLIGQIDKITKLYIASRYQDEKGLLLSLRQQIRTFRPKRPGTLSR
jgi:protein-glutamine gamma-glutamyltransferase